MKAPENKLHDVSMVRIQAALRSAGAQKALAADLNLTDVRISRLINDDLTQVVQLLALLNLEVVEAGHVEDLRRVLKATL